MTVIAVTDHVFPTLDRERQVAVAVGAEFREAQCVSELETIDLVRGANVVFVNFAPITEAVLAVLAPGAVVIRYGVGWDNVDTDAADRLGVSVCNVPDYGTSTVADHAVTLAFMLLRRVRQFDREVSAGQWPKPASQGPVWEFSDVTVGLFGTGKIGLSVAKRFRAFDMTVVAHDPFADHRVLQDAGIERVDSNELWRRSHLISLHAPATVDTYNVVNHDTISMMPVGSLIVNTARGQLLKLDAVVEALRSGHLGGVALDVVDPEPLPREHPIRREKNAILTPHTAFYSERSMDNLQRLASEEANRAISGEALRCRINTPDLMEF